jgi:hypothetical protein
VHQRNPLLFVDATLDLPFIALENHEIETGAAETAVTVANMNEVLMRPELPC